MIMMCSTASYHEDREARQPGGLRRPGRLGCQAARRQGRAGQGRAGQGRGRAGQGRAGSICKTGMGVAQREVAKVLDPAATLCDITL